MKTTTMLRLIAAALITLGGVAAQAMDLRPDAVTLEGGPGRRAPNMVGAGLMWDWNWDSLRKRAELTAHTELLVDRWKIDAVPGASDHLFQFVVLPTLRMRLGRGTSPVFLEAGIGLSWLDREYRTKIERFGSRWNFHDVVGAGYTIGGPQGKNEVGLRWTHSSNGGFVQPNPGQNFLLLRYTRRF